MRKKMRKRIVGIVMIMMIFGGMAACSSGNSNSEPKKVDKSEKTETEAAEAEEKKEPEKTVFGIGETAELDDVQVTMLGYEVPVEWKNIEVHFTNDVWSGNDFVFEIAR